MLLLFSGIYVPVKLKDENGFPRLEKLTEEVAQLKMRTRELRQENRALVKEIRAVQSDPDHIENIARSEMGMITPDEIVYQF